MCAIKWAIYYYEALCFKERFDVTLGKKTKQKAQSKNQSSKTKSKEE